MKNNYQKIDASKIIRTNNSLFPQKKRSCNKASCDMKTFCFFILWAFCYDMVGAQAKHDYNWPLGYGSDPAFHIGGSLVSFAAGKPDTAYFNIQFSYSGDNANISDAQGHLVAYSNGCEIHHRMHQLMENGDNINPGLVHQQQCTMYSGYSFDQGSLFLPSPGSDSLYVLFHLKEEDGGSLSRHLLYSVVDAAANGGLGKVIAKNEFLKQDTLSGMLSACRHANGRDWWVVAQENHHSADLPPGGKAKYHFYLFDPYGIHYQGEQQIGRLFTYNSWVGQSCFSPNGEHYAIGSIYNGVNIFNFDRCTGELSNPLHLEFSHDTVGAMGLAFSPNSRFLYVTTGLWVLQYDLASTDVEGSKTGVAYYDGFVSQLPTNFFQLALAPDGKIYGSASFGVDVLHIIHHPDAAGLDCGVEQHGLKLPTYHKFAMPNVPHYRLYDVPGSVCDSVGVNTPSSAPELESGKRRLYPNPTSGWVNIPNPEGRERLVQVFDLVGTLMQEFMGGDTQIDLSHLNNGAYFLRIRYAGTGQTETAKLLISR